MCCTGAVWCGSRATNSCEKFPSFPATCLSWSYLSKSMPLKIRIVSPMQICQGAMQFPLFSTTSLSSSVRNSLGVLDMSVRFSASSLQCSHNFRNAFASWSTSACFAANWAFPSLYLSAFSVANELDKPRHLVMFTFTTKTPRGISAVFWNEQVVVSLCQGDCSTQVEKDATEQETLTTMNCKHEARLKTGKRGARDRTSNETRPWCSHHSLGSNLNSQTPLSGGYLLIEWWTLR